MILDWGLNWGGIGGDWNELLVFEMPVRYFLFRRWTGFKKRFHKKLLCFRQLAEEIAPKTRQEVDQTHNT